SGGGGGTATCGVCVAPKVCDTTKGICVNPSTGDMGPPDLTNPPLWPQSGMYFSSLFWHLTNTDTTSGGPFSAAMTVDKSNNLILAGAFQGSLDATGGDNKGKLTSAGARDVWLASYDVNLNFRWAKSFGGSGDDW